MPTIEDIRDFQFPSMKECTKDQLEAAEKFIDALNLANLEDETGEKFEGLKPNTTFNPILQNFYQYICSKSFEKSDNIVKIDPIINEYIHPENKLYKAYAKDIEEFKSKFVLKEVDGKKAEGQKVFWRKLLEEQKTKQEATSTIDQSETRSEINLEEMVQQQKFLKHKKFNLDDDEEERIVRNISPINAIEDFQAMITNKKVDLVDDAVKQMQKLILRYVNESIQGSFYKMAIDCLKELRKGCISEDEAQIFNVFLYEIREKFSQGKQINFWLEVYIYHRYIKIFY